MKTLVLFVLGFFLSAQTFAQSQDPACNEFKYIQNKMKAIDATSVDHAVPHADWLDRKYRREDQITVGLTIGRTVVLLLLQRLNAMAYVFTPTRAEAATVTGSYVRSPEAYSRFLQLTPERACRILRYGGSDGDLLRSVTHEVYRELRRASR